eukprot:4722280-Prymnesium_polylepis.1
MEPSSRMGPYFELIENSSGEALLDVLTRYLRTVGTVSTAAARHAGRSESNYEDVCIGLNAVHASATGGWHGVHQ